MLVRTTPRETCLRCEQEGAETKLTVMGHWGICPVHEPEWVTTPAPRFPTPELMAIGVPGTSRR